jgi:prophage regulatory protein
VNQPRFLQAIPIQLFPSNTQEINMVQIVVNKKQRLIRLSEVIRRTGFGKTWIYTLIKSGRFPSQVKTGLRSIAFIESEIDAWIEKIISDSRPVSE